MQQQRTLWPLIILSVLTLSLPATGLGQERETLRENHTASRLYTRQDFSADEFFTQADRDLITRVETNIADDPRTAGIAKNITVGAGQGAVMLGGSVPSEKERDQLVDEVQKTIGVVRVQDNLRVASSARSELRDRRTGVGETETRATTAPVPQSTRGEQRAEAMSARQGSFPAAEPEAKGATGIDEPPLTGSGGMNEEDRTGTTGPSGTRSTASLNTGAVDTMGRITKSAGDEAVTENDRALVSQARAALAGNPTINPTEGSVHLKADNGIIYLSGWAANERERLAMAETVRGLTGVQAVVNNLQVRPGTYGAVR